MSIQRTSQPLYLIWFSSLLLLFSDLSAYSLEELDQLNANNDTGIWAEQVISTELAEGLFYHLHIEQRWGSKARVLWYHEYEQVLEFDLTSRITSAFNLKNDHFFKYLFVGPGFSEYFLIEKNTKGVFHWVSVARPLLQADIITELFQCRISHHFRYEYQYYQATNYKKFGNARYRITIEAPWKFTCLKINPYISNEFFFRSGHFNSVTNPTGLVGGLYENRFRLGINANLADNFIFSIHGQWRPIKSTITPRYFNTYDLGFFATLYL